MGEFRKQVNKGVLELAVLKLIGEKDQYGYSIMQQVSTKSDLKLEIKDGTLYPILYRLEDNQLIESYWKEVEGRGKPRKYYRITELGKEKLDTMIEDYLEVISGLYKLIKVGDEHE